MTLRTLETLLWFVFYGAVAVFLVAWNTASPLYNAVYVARTQSEWLPPEERAYVPGTIIRGTALSAYFGEGWWRPEGNARWGRGDRNTIAIRPVLALPAGSRVDVRIGAQPHADGKPRQVVLEQDGVAFARTEIDAWAPHRLVATLPHAVPAGAETHLSFVVAAESRLAMGVAADERSFGVRFYDLAVTLP